MSDGPADAIRAAILALTAARGPDSSICPSDAARAVATDLGGDWRSLMPEVRAAAAGLAAEGRVVATQRGAVVDAVAARGPIRLRARGPLKPLD